MWQPGHAAIFDTGRTTSNTTSYLEQPATHCSIITQHPPTSRRSGKIPRELEPQSQSQSQHHGVWAFRVRSRIEQKGKEVRLLAVMAMGWAG
ncbi:hypothetical protein LA080_009257 [Diaporthe eres]|nr:hypothetical protein LA080_009257 [Diaporthe eres]